MPILPILSWYCGRTKEIMFVKMVWENTIRTIHCHINVAKWHRIGSWGWVRDQIMDTLKSRLGIYFEGKMSSLEVLEGKTMMNSSFFHSFMKGWNIE